MELERIQTALVLSHTEHRQRLDFRGKKYGPFSIISCRFIHGGVEICKISTTILFSRTDARGTIIKCPERQPLFDLPQFGRSYNQFPEIPTLAIFEVGFLLLL